MGLEQRRVDGRIGSVSVKFVQRRFGKGMESFAPILVRHAPSQEHVTVRGVETAIVPFLGAPLPCMYPSTRMGSR